MGVRKYGDTDMLSPMREKTFGRLPMPCPRRKISCECAVTPVNQDGMAAAPFVVGVGLASTAVSSTGKAVIAPLSNGWPVSVTTYFTATQPTTVLPTAS